MSNEKIKSVTFWVSIACVLIGGVLGIVGIWVPDFLDRFGWKLIGTAFVLLVTSGAINTISGTWLVREDDKAAGQK